MSAVSTSGNRLLAVFDEVGEKENYSKFLGDLEGMFAEDGLGMG